MFASCQLQKQSEAGRLIMTSTFSTFQKIIYEINLLESCLCYLSVKCYDDGEMKIIDSSSMHGKKVHCDQFALSWFELV